MCALIAFLKARYDGIENAARYVLSDYATHSASWDYTSTGMVHLGDDYLLTHDGPIAAHITRHDPAYVLADIAAKRQILAIHKPLETFCGTERDPDRQLSEYQLQSVVTVCMVCDDNDHESGWQGDEIWPCVTLRLLALPFATHPYFREEWKP